MSDTYLEDLEALLIEAGPEPCLWTIIRKLHGIDDDDFTNEHAYSMICTLNNGLRKGFWRIVVSADASTPALFNSADKLLAYKILASKDPEGAVAQLVSDRERWMLLAQHAADGHRIITCPTCKGEGKAVRNMEPPITCPRCGGEKQICDYLGEHIQEDAGA